MEHKKAIINYFKELSYRHNLWTVYSDFLEIGAISIRCSVDIIYRVAQALKEKGLNPQRHLKVTAQDIDIKSVYMSYIQLSLLGIPAQICHANTLSLEVFDVWETPLYILGGWKYRRQIEKEKIEVKQEENGQIKLII